MTDEEVLSVIAAAIADVTGCAASEITSDTTADDVPGWDSLAHVRIMLEVGVRLGVSIDIDRTYRAATVGGLAPIVRQSPAFR